MKKGKKERLKLWSDERKRSDVKEREGRRIKVVE
jgi:hypothetical protein